MDSLPPTIGNLLNHIGELSGDTRVAIEIYGQDEKWIFQARDLKNILMSVIFEVPSLRKSLDEASKVVDTLQKQVDETLTFEPQKWEYVDVPFAPANILDRFNEMGREGWELAYCNWDMKYSIFKRPKR